MTSPPCQGCHSRLRSTSSTALTQGGRRPRPAWHRGLHARLRVRRVALRRLRHPLPLGRRQLARPTLAASPTPTACSSPAAIDADRQLPANATTTNAADAHAESACRPRPRTGEPPDRGWASHANRHHLSRRTVSSVPTTPTHWRSSTPTARPRPTTSHAALPDTAPVALASAYSPRGAQPPRRHAVHRSTRLDANGANIASCTHAIDAMPDLTGGYVNV